MKCGIRVFAIGAAAFLAACASWRLGSSGMYERPLWRTDLAKQGYPSPGWAGTDPSTEREKIAFGSNDELVVLGSTNDPPNPSRVEAYVLNVRTGNVVRREEWMAVSRPNIFATAGGGYAVLTVDGTTLYAAGLKQVMAKVGEGVTMASPDGRSLLVDAAESKPGHAVERLLGADSLRPTGTEFVNLGADSISSQGAATVEDDADTDDEVIVIEDPSGEQDAYSTKCQEVRPRFLSDETLAVVGCGRIEVVRPGAGRICHAAVSREADVAAVARDGGRFAIVEVSWGLGHWGHLQPGTIRVLDVEGCTESFRIEIPAPRGSENDVAAGAALSPDGSLLAINTLGDVSVFRLPPRRSPKGPKGPSKDERPL
jgi:hypothetical protein